MAKGRRACVPIEFVGYDYDYVCEKLKIEVMGPLSLVSYRPGELNVGILVKGGVCRRGR